MSEEPCVCQTGFTCLARHDEAPALGEGGGWTADGLDEPAAEPDPG